jgi:hypothetical protein
MRTTKELTVGYAVDFELLDSVKPSINGKNTFQRLLIRRVGHQKEKFISLCSLCEIEPGSKECKECEMKLYVLGKPL